MQMIIRSQDQVRYEERRFIRVMHDVHVPHILGFGGEVSKPSKPITGFSSYPSSLLCGMWVHRDVAEGINGVFQKMFEPMAADD